MISNENIVVLNPRIKLQNSENIHKPNRVVADKYENQSKTSNLPRVRSCKGTNSVTTLKYLRLNKKVLMGIIFNTLDSLNCKGESS